MLPLDADAFAAPLFRYFFSPPPPPPAALTFRRRRLPSPVIFADIRPPLMLPSPSSPTMRLIFHDIAEMPYRHDRLMRTRTAFAASITDFASMMHGIASCAATPAVFDCAAAAMPHEAPSYAC